MLQVANKGALTVFRFCSPINDVSATVNELILFNNAIPESCVESIHVYVTAMNALFLWQMIFPVDTIIHPE